MSAACFPIAAALLAATALAGCGGAGGAGRVTHQAFDTALRAAACMRANGVPNYPEPKLSNRAIQIAFTPGVNPTTPAVQTAATKCGYRDELLSAATRSRIAFVRCTRMHGMRNFPYPTPQGHVSVEMVRARGINPQSPAVARVVSECLPLWLRPTRTP